MPKRNKTEISWEERFENFKKNFVYVPEPTRIFDVGQGVCIGNLENAIVVWVSPDHKFYEIEYDNNQRDSRSLNVTQPLIRVRNFWMWTEINNQPTVKESFKDKSSIHLSYSNRDVRGLIGMAYTFGVDMNPSYQRDYVWERKDKIELISSIFSNVDIGKFVFVHRGYGTGCMFEVVDGKQRLNALLEFYEGRYPILGNVYYDNLSKVDKYHFDNYPVSFAEVSGISEKEIVKLFLRLNETGRVMSSEHLESVRKNFLAK